MRRSVQGHLVALMELTEVCQYLAIPPRLISQEVASMLT
jgi:hypothetical protein